ncbi:tetratricopeptide repeat protein [Hymenobacter jeollabukensis]|uniref:Tetratricopeptide repeat protein n=1 Tax=Hymenobacter jeollabukensis TaxID=2025313 RepID=A0A5R8WM87_9BACT|nr:tetratricopeptide repeat protein [Hymenobacter jeollabukensis]TLM90503.1 tetratricopeptide repeat protein [Hymenobacter jeollabukensis]
MSLPRRILYALLLVGFAVSVAAVLLARKEAPVPQLKERRGALAVGGEWLNTKQAVAGLQEKLRRNPDDYEARLQLAQAYVQESRVTGDHTYYDAAALKLVDEVLLKRPDDFEALCTKAVISLSQHHFGQGLTLAERAAELNPYNGFVQGLLCDAHVELGHYPEAIKAADRMNELRPDLRAYSRVSYLREIHGDVNGAKEAMDLAVRAGVTGLEQTEWCRVMLGRLYENSGQLAPAEAAYRQALQTRPGYAYAQAGLARVARTRGDYHTAIRLLKQARAQVRDFAFDDELTDLYRLNNQPTQADASAQNVIKQLQAHANTNDQEDGQGHYTDRELAYAYLKAGDLDQALKHAQTEYERRPANIDVCETMAWVHYKRNEYAEARKYMTQALRTNCRNPQLLYRAGCIALRNGEVAQGESWLRQAREQNPNFKPDPTDPTPALLVARR